MTEATRLALELINKQFPKAPLSTLSQSNRAKVESFSTGSLILDKLFGIGGWPKGRLVELYGKPHAGKTTLCLHALAQAQKLGVCAFIDTEQRADLNYAAAIGVDVESLVFDQPKDGEDAYDKIVACLDTGMFSLIVLDSIAHSKPKSVEKNVIGASNVGTHGKLTTNAFERMLKHMGVCAVICTNQIKKDFSGYGTGEYTPGGDAPMFDCDLRVRLKAKPTEKDEEDDPTFNRVVAKVFKNSVGGVPYREAEIILRYGQGMARADDTLEAAVQAEVITRAANGFHSFTHENKKVSIGRSRDAALAWLKERERIETIRRLVQRSDWYVGKAKQADVQEERRDDNPVADLPQVGASGEGEGTDNLQGVRSDIPIPGDGITPSQG